MFHYQIEHLNNQDGFILKFLELYQEKILKLIKKQWKEEDLYGISKVNYDTQYYLYGLIIAELIYIEWTEGLEDDWTVYEDKYNLACIRKTLGCKDINFDEILSIFGLPQTIYEDGIEAMGIESTFEIEPSADTVVEEELDAVDINELLAEINNPTCVNNVETVC